MPSKFITIDKKLSKLLLRCQPAVCFMAAGFKGEFIKVKNSLRDPRRRNFFLKQKPQILKYNYFSTIILIMHKIQIALMANIYLLRYGSFRSLSWNGKYNFSGT